MLERTQANHEEMNFHFSRPHTALSVLLLDKIDLIPFLERIDKIEKSAQDWDNTKDSLTPNFAITLLTDNEEAFNISILGSARNLSFGYYYYQGIDLYGEWDIDTINNEIEN